MVFQDPNRASTPAGRSAASSQTRSRRPGGTRAAPAARANSSRTSVSSGSTTAATPPSSAGAAPAQQLRAFAVDQSGPGRRRRAGQRPRHEGGGPDIAADERPAGGVLAHLSIHHPRPPGHSERRRPGGRHVPRRLLEVGPTGRLFTDPHHPNTRDLLRAVPTPDPETPEAESHLVGDVPSPENPRRPVSSTAGVRKSSVRRVSAPIPTGGTLPCGWAPSPNRSPATRTSTPSSTTASPSGHPPMERAV
jgi:hypothetical protein